MKIFINKSNGDILIKSTHKYVKRVGSRGNYKYFYRVNGKLVEGNATGPGTKESTKMKAGVKKEDVEENFSEQIYKLYNRIAQLRLEGDDQGIRYDIRMAKEKIKELKQKMNGEKSPKTTKENADSGDVEERNLDKQAKQETFDQASTNIVDHIQNTFENGDLTKRSIESGSAAKRITKDYIDNVSDKLHSDKEIEYLKQNKEKMIKDVQKQLNNMDWNSRE